MEFIAKQPQSYLGKAVGSGHCVAFVREAAAAPHTSLWRRGPKARQEARIPGLVIATFDADGTYGNHTDGRSHAAVLMSVHENGALLVLDQWRGQKVHQRVIRAKNGVGLPCDDADRFHVVLTDDPGTAGIT